MNSKGMSMSELFVLDSFAWIEYFLGSRRGEKVQGFIESKKCVTPTIVIAEISAKYSNDNKDFTDKLKFMKFNTKVISLTEDIAEFAGRIKTSQRKIKKDFGLADSIIYATALLHNAKVISGDPHFEDMKEVIII